MKYLFLLCVAFSTVFNLKNIYAGVLQAGEHSFRQEIGQHTATLVWNGGTPSEYGSGNSIVASGANSIVGVGIGDNLEIDVNFQYGSAKVVGNGPVFSMMMLKDGDHLDALSEVGVKLSKQLNISNDGSQDLVIYTGFRTPGDSYVNSNSFLSTNDGITKFDIGFSWQWMPASIGIALDTRYTYKPGPLGDVLNVNLSVPYSLGTADSVGLLMNYVNTMSGYDIMEPDFDAAGMPFSMKKEQFTAYGIFASHAFTRDLSLDGSISTRPTGRNTDNGTSFVAAITKYF
jgi:hypothetical protein